MKTLLASWRRLLAGAGLLVLALPAAAQVTGISYTLSPVGTRVYWSDEAALDNGFLYGGEVGLGFGEFLEVSGLYLFGNNFETDFSGLTGDNQNLLDAIGRLPARDVNVRRFGGKLRINLGTGSLVPFVTAGTGVLRFDPDDLGETEHIYLNGGVGATFSLYDRYTISVAAENLAYRYNVGATFFSEAELRQLGLTTANFNEQTVYNPAVSASLKLYLGGRGAGEMTDVDRALVRQLRGGRFRVAVEPFYGQISFNEDLGLPDAQALAGVNAGIDLGPYIGVRGFYWRGLEDDEAFSGEIQTDFTDLTFYGGELDLRFSNQFAGLAPYLILGGGYMDAGGDYRDFIGFRPEDRYFAIGGGGVELILTRAIRVQGAVRGLFMSNQDVDDVSDPSNVFVSPMYTVGINFNLGGSGRTLGAVVEEERMAAREEEAMELEEMRAMLEEQQMRQDSLAAAREAAFAETVAEAVRAEMLRADTLGLLQDTTRVRHRQMAQQTITVPVPEQGEIYIRFGPPEGEKVQTTVMPFQAPAFPDSALVLDSAQVATMVTAAQIRQIVQEALAEQEEDEDAITAREIDARLRALEARIEERIARAETARMRGDRVDVDVRAGAEASADDDEMTTFEQRELNAIWPVVGVREGEGPTQFLLGARADYGFPGKRYRMIPELALGLSDGGVAISALGNVAYPFLGGLAEPVQPYAGIGAGFVTDEGLSGLDLAFNLFLGGEYTLPNGMTVFAEYSTLDLFDFNRIILGYRFNVR